MSRHLSKVQKQISKKRQGKSAALHEGSRDAMRIQRAGGRQDKLAKQLSSRLKGNATFSMRTMQTECDSTESCSIPEMQELIERYIHRDDETLAALKVQHRPGRPPNPKENLLKQRVDQEEREYISGFWMPDIRSESNMIALTKWDGEWVALATMDFIRVAKDGTVSVSSFPPKGQS
ncbi:hypothetical protein EJ06DRAFT_477875 [Trichodelitschia bisporula]|uniref:Translation machinery-associated protein 16 n=1 Tax=Trichodelitschia bisporula TaxID=703511 RepID=A0A6G1HVE4_9PEZI|nr:hypothetical protein EJ06DRAFT_477875 [Trichodelitschia bisporula]